MGKYKKTNRISANGMVEYWLNFIKECQDRGYYKKVFVHKYSDNWFGELKQYDRKNLVKDLNKIFKKLHPNATSSYDEIRIAFSVKDCTYEDSRMTNLEDSKKVRSKKLTYREFGDKSTDGTGPETDNYYCIWLR